MGPLHPVEMEIRLLGPPWWVLVLSHSSTVLSVRESVMFILSYFRKHREESQSWRHPCRIMHSAEREGQGSTPGQWHQLTELIVVAFEKGLPALLLFTGLLTAARGITATVFLSSGWEVCIVLKSRKEKKKGIFQAAQYLLLCCCPWRLLLSNYISVPSLLLLLFTIWIPLSNSTDTELFPSVKGRG